MDNQRQGQNASEIDWSIGKRVVKDERLYAKELERAVQCCGEAAHLILGSRAKDGSENDGRSLNTVVGVVGERGTGKTSFLHTLVEKLPDECYVLDVVDPSDFQSGMSALELFLAGIYRRYIAASERRYSAVSSYEPARLHSLFRKVSKSLSSIRVNESVYHADNPSMEVLGHMVDLLDTSRDLRELCSEFLAFINAGNNACRKTHIVMLIDDVDMINNEKVYELMEDIRKFLSGQAVVVLDYREKQLIDSIFERKLRDNKALLDRGLSSNGEIQSQIEDFIEKVVPLDRTIRLFSQNDLLNAKVLDVLSAAARDRGDLVTSLIDPYRASCGIDEDVAVRDWVDAVLYEKALIHLVPIVRQEETSFVWPRNLREFVSLAKVLHCDMRSLSAVGEGENRFALIGDNLERYRSFFLGRLHEALDPALCEMVERWLKADCHTKNYVAYTGIYDLIFSLQDSLRSEAEGLSLEKVLGGDISASERQMREKLLDANLLRPENVTIGDVSDILNKYIRINHGDAARIHLGYALKILYSMEFLGYILGALEDADRGVSIGGNASAQSYLDLLNSCVVPPELDSSPLVYSILYLGESDKWSESSRSGSTDNLPTDEAAQRVMALLGCTTFEVPVATSRRESTLFRSSRPLRGETARSFLYEERENRPMFTMSRINPRSPSKAGMPDVSSPGHPSYYSICLLNILGKQEYLDAALEAIVSNSGDEDREPLAGSYVFYSMFDLDVFGSMRLSARERKEELARNQIRRLNTALIYKLLEKDDSSEKDDAVNSNILIDIKIPFEQELIRQLHTPFVYDTSFRLYGEGSSDRLVTCEEVVQVIRASAQMRFSVQRLSLAARRLIGSSGKEEFRSFADSFASELERSEDVEEAIAVLDVADRLRRPNTRPAESERRLMADLAIKFPHQANSAFNKINHG